MRCGNHQITKVPSDGGNLKLVNTTTTRTLYVFVYRIMYTYVCSVCCGTPLICLSGRPYVATRPLVTFLSSLMIAGIVKGQWMYSEDANIYSVLTEQITPYLRLFWYSGFGVFIGLALMVIPLLRGLVGSYKD